MGIFNGSKTVKLWNAATGQVLAQTTVTSANAWQFVNISPVNVQTGASYIVGAYLAGSGASYRVQIQTLPQTYGNITIETSLLDAGDTQPTTASTTRMYGQADISFVAGGTGGNQNPVITTTANYNRLLKIQPMFTM